MKITLTVDFKSQEIIRTLMEAIRFMEVDRVATGGMMSGESLLITYEGKEGDYNDNYYIETEVNPNGYITYYSLKQSNGYYTNDIERFFKAQKEALSGNKFNIKRFNQ